jgi:hypothetical protein
LLLLVVQAVAEVGVLVAVGRVQIVHPDEEVLAILM